MNLELSMAISTSRLKKPICNRRKGTTQRKADRREKRVLPGSSSLPFTWTWGPPSRNPWCSHGLCLSQFKLSFVTYNRRFQLKTVYSFIFILTFTSTNKLFILMCFKKILFIYFRQRGKEGEREGEKHQRVVASHTFPPLGTWPGPQPRHVPWLGIEPATLWFTGQHSVHWATPARAHLHVLSTISLDIDLL